jgi:16S rRNA (cytidine1402-2'-O)-methyltransferase
MAGRLFVVGTPIGNLEDITLRAVRVLGEVAAIACEDTRQTVKILNRFGIKKPLLSYFHPREGQRIPEILRRLAEGQDVALVSDAGTPGISDPGFPLIREALKAGVAVVPVPGPAAVTAALSAAGLPTHRFVFLGFPPPKRTGLRKLLEARAAEEATLVFYLPTRRLAEFLEAVEETLGDRRIVVARELTKVHEEFHRGSATELRTAIGTRVLKGEATVLVEGAR